jgi:hypothetical protein
MCLSPLTLVAIAALAYGVAVTFDMFGAATRMPKWLQGLGAQSIVVRRVAGAAVAVAGLVALATSRC